MKINLDDPKLTAYALNELPEAEKLQVEAALFASPEAQELVRELRLLSGNLRAEYAAERDAHVIADGKVVPLERKDEPRSFWRRLALAAAIALCASLAALAIGRMQRIRGVAGPGKANLPPVATGSAETERTIVTGSNVPTAEEVAPKDELQALAAAARNRALAEPPPPPPATASTNAAIASSKSSTAPGLNAARGLVAKQAPASPFSPGLGGGFDKEAEKLRQDFNTARYGLIEENAFLAAESNPLSTFSIDVDTASYSNVRRFIENGSLPPKDAIRVEEMINYFSYDYPQPNEKLPFSVNLDAASCPWQSSHRLVRIGLKGRELPNEKRPPSNLVFLLDVSGSMEPANRLPLVKQAMRLLVDKLNENDRVAIVIYAGGSGLALPSTAGDKKEQILSAIDNLQANGSTNGAEGIELAYQTAAGPLHKAQSRCDPRRFRPRQSCHC